MKQLSLQEELQANAYPGRGIVIGKTPDGTRAVTAYFIMGRSENSRNRIFVEDGKASAPRHLIQASCLTRVSSSMLRCVYWATKRL